MSSPARDEFGALEAALGYRFRRRELLVAALTHGSALPPGAARRGEQLEFLGDAVLGLAVADLLLQAEPDADEGRLSKRRAQLVRTQTLAAKARALGLGGMLRLGRGEERSGGRAKESILAAAFEAVLGAVFRDGGFRAARRVVARQFRAALSGEEAALPVDWKTTLQERTQARLGLAPEYRAVAETGPAHARRFTVEVWVGGRPLGRGEGSSKRQAEQGAARAALERLEAEPFEGR